MTPQLQQAIRLLQLSTMDLQQEIQQALDSNPMLETSDDEPGPGDSAGSTEGSNEPVAPHSDGPLESLEQAATGDSVTADSPQNLPDELPVDTQWDDLLPSSSAPPPAPAEEAPGLVDRAVDVVDGMWNGAGYEKGPDSLYLSFSPGFECPIA